MSTLVKVLLLLAVLAVGNGIYHMTWQQKYSPSLGITYRERAPRLAWAFFAIAFLLASAGWLLS